MIYPENKKGNKKKIKENIAKRSPIFDQVLSQSIEVKGVGDKFSVNIRRESLRAKNGINNKKEAII